MRFRGLLSMVLLVTAAGWPVSQAQQSFDQQTYDHRAAIDALFQLRKPMQCEESPPPHFPPGLLRTQMRLQSLTIPRSQLPAIMESSRTRSR
jgi:hypothetical protein